jgi:hypothetical protein
LGSPYWPWLLAKRMELPSNNLPEAGKERGTALTDDRSGRLGLAIQHRSYRNPHLRYLQSCIKLPEPEQTFGMTKVTLSVQATPVGGTMSHVHL